VTSEKQTFRWGIERRLEFIEFRLFWEGGVNRSDLVEEFGVSVPQASKDLSLYQENAPQNIEYDKSLKRYFASNSFRPTFIQLDADAYLERLTTPPPKATGSEAERYLSTTYFGRCWRACVKAVRLKFSINR
jgi:hypothetical protein